MVVKIVPWMLRNWPKLWQTRILFKMEAMLHVGKPSNLFFSQTSLHQKHTMYTLQKMPIKEYNNKDANIRAETPSLVKQ